MARTSPPSTARPGPAGAGRLVGGRMGVWGIVFYVVSAAAPLTVIAGGMPLAVRLGGIGAPGAIIVCGVVLVLFAVGFTAMSRHVRDAGAFYAYVGHGLGRDAGNGVAVMTTAGYGLLLVGFYGFVGYFASQALASVAGVALPWWVCGFVAVAVVGVLGYRRVDVGAKVLAVLLTAEVAVVLALAVAVLVQGGPEPLSAEPLNPSNIFLVAGAGSLFVLGFGSYIGFEGTAIYAEEARSPDRTVPAATYLAIGFLSLFYGFAYWAVIAAFGADGVLAVAHRDGFGDMVFVAGSIYLGRYAEVAMQILMVTSFLASLIAFHNACARYLFSMGRAGLLPAFLARTHPRTGSPHRASQVITIVALVALVLAVLTGGDPYEDLGLWTYSAGVVAVVAAQAVCALAVIAFFARDRRGHGIWRVRVAPALAVAGLGIGLLLIAGNFEVITGRTGLANWVMLSVTPLCFAAGVLRGRLVPRPATSTDVPCPAGAPPTA